MKITAFNSKFNYIWAINVFDALHCQVFNVSTGGPMNSSGHFKT